MKNDKNILVFGVGNEILTDDGIGPKLVKHLEENHPFPNVSYETAFLGGLEVLESVQGYETVIFIDAIKTKNGIPGDLYLFTPEDFKETLHLSNFHDINFLSALELGKNIDLDVPKNISIIAIEIFEDLEFSDEFSPAVREKYPEIKKQVSDYLEEQVAKLIV